MKQARVVAIIQARMSSSRLPGKVLQDIGGKTMLERVIERARMARRVDEVAVATTVDSSDDALAAFCKDKDIPCSRGSLQDVLDRYYQAAKAFRADVVVRLTADCPLLDPGLVDETIRVFFDQQADFAANRLPPPFTRTYPIGLDTEVVSFSALERAWKEAEALYEREHVLPYLYDQEGRFKVARVEYGRDLGHYRWTVDTPQDLELIREVVRRLGDKPDFTWLDVLALFEADPTLSQINADVHHKSFLDVDERAQQKPM